MKDLMKFKDYSILLVDDDADKLRVDELYLKDYGYRVYKVSSGEEAIEFLSKKMVDILIIDYYMKGISGGETIEKIRESNHEVVIILQTGYVHDRPPIDMLKTLDIQGYHDKSEGKDKLLALVLSATRMSSQIKQMKSMVEEIATAQKTLSEMKENQSWLIEQVRLSGLGERLGTIFHDMTNSLSAIEAHLRMIDSCAANIVFLKDTGATLDNKDVLNMLGVIKEQCRNSTKRIQYIKDMKNIVVAQSKREKISTSEIFFVEHLLKTVEFFAADDVKKFRAQLIINNKVSDDAKIQGKEVSLVQVLNNLISNSAQAYRRGGKIDLDVEEVGDGIQFAIKDSAGGIPVDIQKKLFKEMVTTKGKEGSGIGVYSSNLVISEYFKGKLWFDSIEGQGTTFYIWVPRYQNKFTQQEEINW